MSVRPYRGSKRRATTEQTRARLLKAAAAMLAAPGGLSLESVARKAGVTRLTVYNQFGSRRALLEGVFDDMAEHGGLHRIRDAASNADPHAGLREIVSIFCDFWNIHRLALWRLHAATAADPELEQSFRARNGRRRRLLSVLVDRIIEDDERRSAAAAELVDVLFALTSVSFYRELTEAGHKRDAACRLIQALTADAVQRACHCSPSHEARR